MLKKPSMAEAAAELAKEALAVFPLRPEGKKPLHTGWQDQATRNPKRALRMFRGEPAANIGVATGLPSQVIVIDVDVKNGAPGLESLGRSS